MKRKVIDFIVCPACLPNEIRLDCGAVDETDGDIETGALTCPACGASYPIIQGVAHLVSSKSPTVRSNSSKYENPEVLSSYLWSHFSDLLGDADAHTAYGDWSSLVAPDSGTALDTGCATGRFTFELSRKCEFAVGVDYSTTFVRSARALMKNRAGEFDLIEEGLIRRQRGFLLPETWDSNKVEFLVADAQALPFKSNRFSIVTSLNLVDKLSRPLAHLKEINRVAGITQSQFLFSDPFSWSQDIAETKEWLGGLTEGPFAGFGIDNISNLVEGGRKMLLPAWNVEGRGTVWWKIRNHRNHFELIRSCFLKATR
ncbi:MAG: methyltransferase domain-containing protein [Deltaproteobacteria bacterium]|nr:methyltransferase domain-containing protein [Deltaproteobacteria bacterium]